jgi:signal transduction histidine kinase
MIRVMEFLIRHARLIRFAVLAACAAGAAYAVLTSGGNRPEMLRTYAIESAPQLDAALAPLIQPVLNNDRMAIAANAGAGVIDPTVSLNRITSSQWRLSSTAGEGGTGQSIITHSRGSFFLDPPATVASLALLLDRIAPQLTGSNGSAVHRLETPDGWIIALTVDAASLPAAGKDVWNERQQSWTAGSRRHFRYDTQQQRLYFSQPVRQGGRLIAAAVTSIDVRAVLAESRQTETHESLLLLLGNRPLLFATGGGVKTGDDAKAALTDQAGGNAEDFIAAVSAAAGPRKAGDLLILSRRIADTPLRAAVISEAPVSPLSLAETDREILILLVIIAVLGVTLFVSDRLARREFIRPARSLIAHIEAENRNVSDGPPPGVPQSWLPWFTTISRIFEENRSLVRHLTETLENLDNAVDERTRELQQKNRELEQALKKLREAQDQIVSQEKLASLGALTAGIAHEIKNPLNFVTNFAQTSVELADELSEILEPVIATLPEDGRSEIEEIIEDLRSNAGRIDSHGKRADSIVRSMLAHARESKGEPERVDINALVKESANLAFHGRRAQDRGFNVTIDYALDAAPSEIKAVPQELNRVVLNLVGNAFDAVRERSGKETAEFKPLVTVSTKNSGDGIELSVRDNGSGIPAAVREKLFTPFFTTKPTGSGTGLGLSICHDIVRRHNGRISVESKPGDHTVFRVWLPVDA